MSEPPSVSSLTFAAEVLQSAQPVLVDFWAPWCGPCKMMLPLLEKTAEKYKGKMKVVKLNTEENKEIADQHQVMSIPSMIMFAKGEEVGRIAGVMDENRLHAEIGDLLEMAG
ncbi:MAG: thioredoxin [Candidatus Margulisbacteria bacterium]|nr:thioredoxin [Candidatus Margulisiibacteriota bacterium]MBU1616312.1 thioredoxin [Candidatus Margulisiibacteriota bacterium]